jgi:hypothetical protein
MKSRPKIGKTFHNGPFAFRRKLSRRCVVQDSKIDLLMPGLGPKAASSPTALCPLLPAADIGPREQSVG